MRRQPTESEGIRRVKRELMQPMLQDLFSTHLHVKQIESLIDLADGVLHANKMGIRAIGAGLAAANGLDPEHATKQVDRSLSNRKITMDSVFHAWVPFVLAQHQGDIFVNLDWTEFAASNQSMLVLGMQTNNGRSVPLMWRCVTTSELKEQRNHHEDYLISQFAQLLPPKTKVTIVADRGFGDSAFYPFLKQLGFDYLIRFRSNINITDAHGQTRLACDWLAPSGRMVVLRQAFVTEQKQPVPVVLCVKDPKMKAGWYLASSRTDLGGSELKRRYGKRFTIEESFRDLKNHRLGLGLEQVVTKRTDRREKLFLAATLAHTLLTLLGQAGRLAGLDKYLGATKVGGLSFFRMGSMLYSLLPTMREHRLRPLLLAFAPLLQQHPLASLFSQIL